MVEHPLGKGEVECSIHSGSTSFLQQRKPSAANKSAARQKLYYRGLNPDGTPNDIKDHRTRVRLNPFVKSTLYSRETR